MKTLLSTTIFVFLFTVEVVLAQQDAYEKTAASKLFNAVDYAEMLLPSVERRKAVDDQQAKQIKYFQDMLREEPEFALKNTQGPEASYAPLDLMLDEVSLAEPFLKRLTNSMPLDLSDFTEVDPNANPAVALWVSALQSYQDGEVRVVIPADIRLLTFLTPVVQGIATPELEDGRTYQWVEDRMIIIVTKMYLEAARSWGGDFLSLRQNELNFNEQGHQYFWETLISYLGILSHYDREYVSTYFTGLLMCEYDSLTRWIWDKPYLDAIMNENAGMAGIPWATPAQTLIPFGKDYLPEMMPELLGLTGSRLIDLGDQLNEFCLERPAGDFKATTIFLKEVCGRVCKLPEQYAESDILPLTTNGPRVRISTDDEFMQGVGKWKYFWEQHIRLIQVAQENNGEDAGKQLIWLRKLRMKLSKWNQNAEVKKELGPMN